MTYHGGKPTQGYIRNHKRVWDYDLEYARQLIPRAKEAGIAVGYEILGQGFDYLKYVCDRVAGWDIHLDIGHGWMEAGTDEKFFEYIDEFQGRIAEVHHNGVNHYWGRYMEHQPPHLNNTIDFQRVYERLSETGYEGPIVCEIQGNDIAQAIEHCLESKAMIVGIWEGTLRLAERWNVAE